MALIFFFWKDWNLSSSQQINSQKFSEFGDFIGGVIGPLWALAGVILFYVALREQREDFKTNRDALNTQVRAFEQQIREFELQRKELELTREVLVEQNKMIKLQQFESTFFNSLELFNNLIDTLSVHYREFAQDPLEHIQGRNIFSHVFSIFGNHYNDKMAKYVSANIDAIYTKESLNIPLEDYRQIIYESYEKTFLDYQSFIGHYFRTIYNIIKLVDEKCPTTPKYYTNLIRAQLSSYEHVLLFYNCLTPYGMEKFKPLIEKYALLDNMPISLLLDFQHKEFYSTSAYD